MNPWPFVAAAYLLVWAGTTGLILSSWLGLRRAERQIPSRDDRT